MFKKGQDKDKEKKKIQKLFVDIKKKSKSMGKIKSIKDLPY